VFEEVSPSSGIQHEGPSAGASWGDVNGDGWPDLWVGNHTEAPNLFQNNKNGTFSNISNQLFNNKNADMHGAAWADFDNDGDQDLFIEVGAQSGTGGGANQLLINSNGVLQDKAAAYGLSYPQGRGRTPLWLDWDADGNLDILITNAVRPDGAAPTALFSQAGNSFQNSFLMTGLTTTSGSSLAQLTFLKNNAAPVLLISGSPFPNRAYDLGSTPFVGLNGGTGLFPNFLWLVKDAAIADFDGNLLSDVFIASLKTGSEVVLETGGQISARINAKSEEKGFSFNSVEDISVQIDSPTVRINNIFIGEQGLPPSRTGFTLSPQDTAVTGIMPHTPGVDRGIYIGHDPALNQWTFLVSADSRFDINFTVTTASGISEVFSIGLENSDGARADNLLIQTDGSFIDTSTIAGIDSPTQCGSVIAADLDNDMDVDLYLVCHSPVKNRPNILYENMGDGTFLAVAGAGGAEGSSEGHGDSVAAADYDNDGFIDLFVTNGGAGRPFNNGPSQLFRNTGNNNHWIEIDLEGVTSNRDGIGARVLVTAGGVTQLREQGGGMHHFSQNHQRLHFGLGTATAIDKIDIEWPSGIVQEINNLPADEIVHVIEPGSPSVHGKPTYAPGVEGGVYIWKEAFDGAYHLRVNGNGALSKFNVQLIADQTLQAVLPFQLNTYDTMDWVGNHFFLTSNVNAGQDGIDINLPSSANALIAVEQDGAPNPRQLHIGASGKPLAPAGWIVDIDKLPELPQFQGGKDLGLFVGKNDITDPVVVRWNGDGQFHRADLTMLFSEPVISATQVGFETNDTLESTVFSVRSSGIVSSGWDGLNVAVQQGSKLGFAYVQDGLSQPNPSFDFADNNCI
jgi:hypothetical protein